MGSDTEDFVFIVCVCNVFIRNEKLGSRECLERVN